MDSAAFWAMHNERFAAELHVRGLTRGQVCDSADAYELAGWTFVIGGSVKELGHEIGLPPPPEPLFRVIRSTYWLRDDLGEWLAPHIRRQRERHLNAERRRSAVAVRSERAAERLSNAPVGPSGYRHVSKHKRTGLWRAALHLMVDGQRTTISGGYYKDVKDAARAADFIRWQHGFPPINLPEDFASTLARRDEWEERSVLGPRGVTIAIAEALRRHGPLSIDEAFTAVRHLDTTRKTVAVILPRLANEGRATRVQHGIYAAAESVVS